MDWEEFWVTRQSIISLRHRIFLLISYLELNFSLKMVISFIFYFQYIFLIKLQSLYYINYIVKTRFMWTLNYRPYWILCNSKCLNMLFLVCKQFKQPFKLQILKTGFSNDRKFSWTLIWESVLDNGKRRNTVVLDSLSQVNLTRDQVHPPTIILSFRNAT